MICEGYAFWRGKNPSLDGRGFVGKGSVLHFGEKLGKDTLLGSDRLLSCVGKDSFAYQGKKAWLLHVIKDSHVFRGKKV